MARTSFSAASPGGYLKKAVGIGEVAVGMAALVEPLQQGRDAMPLGPFVSLLEEASRELKHTNGGNRESCNKRRRHVRVFESFILAMAESTV